MVPLLSEKKDRFLSSGEDGGGGAAGSAVSGGVVAVMPELK
jgi:hypothetical protein